MRRNMLAIAAALLLVPAVLSAQAAPSQPQQPTLRDQLMPAGNAVLVTAPVVNTDSKVSEATSAEEKNANQPVMAAQSGRGVGLMIAGLALFVAGLVIDDDDAGTVLVLAGAGIGAYGLYLYFR